VISKVHCNSLQGKHMQWQGSISPTAKKFDKQCLLEGHSHCHLELLGHSFEWILGIRVHCHYSILPWNYRKTEVSNLPHIYRVPDSSSLQTKKDALKQTLTIFLSFNIQLDVIKCFHSCWCVINIFAFYERLEHKRNQHQITIHHSQLVTWQIRNKEKYLQPSSPQTVWELFLPRTSPSSCFLTYPATGRKSHQ